MAQHAFRRKHHQRLTPGAKSLPAQQVKVLRRGRRLRNLEIVLRRKLQKALNARARVLRTLAFVAVRQQQHEAGQQIPLGFAGHNKLIDDRLSYIGEVTELRLPKHERLRVVAAIAVLKAQNSSLGKRRVVDSAM